MTSRIFLSVPKKVKLKALAVTADNEGWIFGDLCRFVCMYLLVACVADGPLSFLKQDISEVFSVCVAGYDFAGLAEENS